MKRFTLVCALAFAVYCTSTAASDDDPTLALATDSCPEADTLTAAERARVRCGWLEVPGNDGPQSIAVAVIESDAPSDAEPLVLFSGGPAQESVRYYREDLDNPFGKRTVILFDPRGVGLSRPQLCPELRQQTWDISAQGLSLEHETKARVETVRRCRDELLRRGVDLSVFHQGTIVEDAERLRRALRIERWHVYGVSYGARPALSYVQRHPHAVSALVLDAPYAPAAKPFSRDLLTLMESVRGLDALCAAQNGCRERWGLMEEGLLRVIEEFDAHPLHVVLGRGQQPRNVRIHGRLALLLLAMQLYDPASHATFPLFIERMLARDADVLRPVIESVSPSSGFMQNFAAYLAIDCLEAWGADSEAEYRERAAQWPALHRAKPLTAGYHLDVCPMWVSAIKPSPQRHAPAGLTQIPTLVASGGLDPSVPMEAARDLARALGATLIAFPYEGHSIHPNACGASLIRSFLENPTATLDTSCISETSTPPSFLTRAVLIPRFAGLASEHRRTLGWTSAALIAPLFLVAVMPRRVLRMRATTSLRKRVLPGLAIAAAMVFLPLILLAQFRTDSVDYYLSAIGVEFAWWPVFALPWISLAALIGTILMYAFQRERPDILATLMLAATFVALACYAALGLLTPTFV